MFYKSIVNIMNNIAYYKKKSLDSLVMKSLNNIWYPCTQIKYPIKNTEIPLIPISHGNGPWLIDVSGRRYLNAISSW